MNVKKTILFVAITALSFGLWGCKWFQSAEPTCDVTAKYAAAAAGQVAPVLGCTGTAAMAADFNAELQKLNLCKQAPAAGPISNAVCPAVAGWVVGLGTAQVASLKPLWACTGGAAAAATQQALLDACLKAPF